MFTESDLDRALTHWRKESQMTRYIIPSCAMTTTTKHHVKDARRVLANDLEGEAARRLAALGFIVRPQSHKAHHDITAIDPALGGMLRVEVKAAHWDGKRYQFNLRDNQADVYLFACVNGALNTTAPSWFVVPCDQVEDKRMVEIRPHNPADHVGKLTAFYEAWDTLPDLARSTRNPFQMDLGIAG